jgi:hypothetical protein
MGLLDILAGRDTRPQRPAEEEQPTTSEAASSSEVLRDAAPQIGSFSTQQHQRLYDPYGEARGFTGRDQARVCRGAAVQQHGQAGARRMRSHVCCCCRRPSDLCVRCTSGWLCRALARST